MNDTPDMGVNPDADSQAGSPPASNPVPSQELGAQPTSPSPGEPAQDDANRASNSSDDGKRVVDADRLNQLIEDSKRLKTLESDFASSREDMQRKLDAIAAAASGKTPEEVDSDIQTLSGKWNVPHGFVQDLFDAALSRSDARIEERLRPIKTHSAQAVYDREWADVVKQYPNAGDLTNEEQAEFKKLALDKRYVNTPLKDVWKVYAFDKPQGRSATAESSRPGSRSFQQPDVDIAGMSLEQFEEYSNKLAGK